MPPLNRRNTTFSITLPERIPNTVLHSPDHWRDFYFEMTILWVTIAIFVPVCYRPVLLGEASFRRPLHAAQATLALCCLLIARQGMTVMLMENESGDTIVKYLANPLL